MDEFQDALEEAEKLGKVVAVIVGGAREKDDLLNDVAVVHMLADIESRGEADDKRAAPDAVFTKEGVEETVEEAAIAVFDETALCDPPTFTNLVEGETEGDTRLGVGDRETSVEIVCEKLPDFVPPSMDAVQLDFSDFDTPREAVAVVSGESVKGTVKVLFVDWLPKRGVCEGEIEGVCDLDNEALPDSDALAVGVKLGLGMVDSLTEALFEGVEEGELPPSGDIVKNAFVTESVGSTLGDWELEVVPAMNVKEAEIVGNLDRVADTVDEWDTEGQPEEDWDTVSTIDGVVSLDAEALLLGAPLTDKAEDCR